MSQVGNDRKEAPESLTKRILVGSKKTKTLFTSSPCIYRVPENLRKVKESAYTPRLISIGPFHRQDVHLSKTMQDVKMYYAKQLFSRVTKGIADQGKRDKEQKWKLLQECVDNMKELVDEAKKCYAEEEVKNNDEMEEVKNNDEMAEMMLIDGCFILELLYYDKENKEAAKDSGNSKASRGSAPQPVNEGEDGRSNVGGSIISSRERHNLFSQATSSSVSQPVMLDPIFDNILKANIVKHDLLLFENQIPFFVLEELFKLTVDKIPDNKIPGGKKLSLTEYVISYFRNIISPENENSGSEMKTSCCVISVCGSKNECERGQKVSEKDKKYDHILHLLHHYYVPGDQGANSTGGCYPWRCTIPGCCSPCRCTVACCSCSPWRCTIGCDTTPKEFSELEICATDLDYAGVKFVPIGIEGNNLFDVKFEERKCLSWWFRRARFEIPTLLIHDPTEPLLRNLIAFEQCCFPRITMIFTSYAKFMDMLIDSEKDVKVLRKAKVIRNLLGEDKDVSELFNKLCEEVVINKFYFDPKCQDAYKYSKHWWPKCMAYLRRTYFASPWAFIGFCLALIAFAIQITNFVRSF